MPSWQWWLAGDTQRNRPRVRGEIRVQLQAWEPPTALALAMTLIVPALVTDSCDLRAAN